MCADHVRDILDEECGRAHAVALTQASEFGSTQRIEERCAEISSVISISHERL